MPDPNEEHLFTITHDLFIGSAEVDGETEKQFIRQLNAKRDWLKHNNPRQFIEMGLGDSSYG